MEKVQRKDVEPGNEFIEAATWETTTFVTHSMFTIRAGSGIVTFPANWVYRIKEDEK